MAETSVMMVYVTAPSRDEALRLAEVLIHERLAACANVIDSVTSLYWWEGQVQRESEASLVLKTRGDLVEALIARIRELHSYTVPCVVAWPIAEGNPAFLDWVRTETRTA